MSMHASRQLNVCDIKYLMHPPSVGLHLISQYEYAKREGVPHSTFAQLKAAIVSLCPPEVQCVEPIAMLHELVWRKRREEEDRLLRPIFQACYFLFLSVYLADRWRDHRRSMIILIGPRLTVSV